MSDDGLRWIPVNEVMTSFFTVYILAKGCGPGGEQFWADTDEPAIRIKDSTGFDAQGRWNGIWCLEDIESWIAWDAERRLGKPDRIKDALRRLAGRTFGRREGDE